MTTPWTVERVRNTFIEYFVSRDHEFIPSSPVIIPSDPTLLFANAGMNQFKPIFLGTVDPNSDFGKLKRAVNSQKCIRAGGKHNDLRDVGKDSYHHTFFEMLGTWSFGDYFKTDCIRWAWELLTEVYGLDKSRLYATYFMGDEQLGLEPDEEARQEWLKYLPEDQILGSGAKDNFWEMGATGPCGPCSEIHYDKVGNGYGRDRVNKDDPEVIEIWNLVFMQFVREEEGGALKSLPAKHCDTGMGLERLSAILAGVPTNYDIDIFQNLFTNIQRVVNCETPYRGRYFEADDDGKDMAYRTIADHIRTITIAISDGAIPSNIGAGYVLRRILRRAVVAGFEKLGEKRGFFSELAPVVIELMGDAFPSLKNDPERVISIIKDEEMQFSRTLRLGLRKFNLLIKGKDRGFVIPGSETARLYHTYGFPFDLTRRMAKERGMCVDKAAHNQAMIDNAGVEAAGKKKMDLLGLHGGAVADLVENQIAITNDSFKYHPEPINATLVAIWCGRIKGFVDFIDDSFFNECKANPDADNPKNHVGLIFDKTNFYAEQGGQIFDTGVIRRENFIFNVESVQISGGYVVHYGTPSGDLKLDDQFSLEVDDQRRIPITSNHTATHLCNFSLRKNLGDHIEQQGSRVEESKFRFDFNHTKPLTYEELKNIDETIRSSIQQNLSVYAEEVPLSVATKINGVRQMFDEKYPDPVRVVAIGIPIEDLVANPTNPEWSNFAIEFCGGTHTRTSAEILNYVTISEDAISKGVRRVVSLTGPKALEALDNAQKFETQLSTVTNLTGNELSAAVADLLKDLDAQLIFPYADKLRFRNLLGEYKKTATNQLKEQEKLFKQRATDVANQAVKQLSENPTNYLVLTEELGGNCGLVKTTIKNIHKTHPSVPVCIISTGAPGKVSVVAVSDKSIMKTLPANEWVTKAVSVVNGKGGGKPDGAQGVCQIDNNEQVALMTQAANDFAASRFSL